MVRMTMGSPPPKPQLGRPRHPLGTAPPTGAIHRALASQGLSKEPPVSAPDSLSQGKERLPTVTPVTMVSQENQAPTFAAAAPASPPYKAKPTTPVPAKGQAPPGDAPRGRESSKRPGGSYAASHTQGEGVTEMTPRCVCNWDQAQLEEGDKTYPFFPMGGLATRWKGLEVIMHLPQKESQGPIQHGQKGVITAVEGGTPYKPTAP